MTKNNWASFNKAIKIIGYIAIASLFIITTFYYPQLPDTIPIHFNIKGEPDGFGSKNTIWVMPFIALGCFLLINFLNKSPHLLNIPVKITEENKEYQYRLISKSILVFNCITTIFLFYINLSIIKFVLGESVGMGTFSVIIYLVSIILGMAYYFYLSFNEKKLKK